MSELKPTPGEWAVAPLTPCRVDTSSGSISVSWSSNHDNGAREREAESNARLIAEAGTVFHETGLSPRQLAERCAELVEALRALRLAREQDKYRSWEMGVPEFNKAEALADAALAKCQPKPQEVK